MLISDFVSCSLYYIRFKSRDQLNIQLIEKCFIKLYWTFDYSFFFFTATNRQEQKDRVKIFKQIWRNLPFGTNLLWMSVKVFFKQIRIFLCGQFLMSRTAQCAQLL